METLEKSRMCRLCGKQSGISIDIFDKNENHVKKINAILPVMVHEMDLLPKQMCHRCSYKLEEFYSFYTVCVKTDSELKSQLSWMRKEDYEEKIITPMVKMNRFKIKTEPSDDSFNCNSDKQMSEGTLIFPSVLNYSSKLLSPPCSKCKCLCNKSFKVNKQFPKDLISTSSEVENQAHSSKIHNNKKDLIEIEDVNNKDFICKNLYNASDCKEISSKHIPVVSLENCIKLNDYVANSESNTKNRALRPRKNSVDYVGPKKRGTSINLKTKFKNKIDLLDPTLVNLVDIKMSQGNSSHPSPIIKLEKVDETVMNLRTQRNLETFEKRIKEFKKDLRKRQNHGKNNSWSVQKRSRKSLHIEENLNKNRKNVEVLNGPSMQKVTHNKRSFQVEDNRKSEKSLHVNLTVDSNEIVHFTGLKIKQEQMADVTEESLQNNSVQEILKINSAEHQKILKCTSRHPMCAVVKLEKDYTCNVDYPRIKIKRNLNMVNSSPTLNCTVNVAPISVGSLEIRLPLNKDKNLNSPLKKSRKKEKNSKVAKTNLKSRKSLKIPNKNLSAGSLPVEFKRYCEKCDISFRNKELYQLHSCYQK